MDRPMILLLGQRNDPPIDLVSQALSDQGCDFRLLDGRHFAEAKLNIDFSNKKLSGRLLLEDEVIPLEDVTGVFARPVFPELSSPGTPTAVRSAEFFQNFINWLDVADAIILNRPHCMESNTSKPMQAQWISEVGFPIPETLVTSHSEAVREFHSRHSRIIFKSISGVRSIVREFNASFAERLPLLIHLPVQFQEYIEGVDVRVHVVGANCLAAEISSNATDYRYTGNAEHTSLSIHCLPDVISEKCVQLSRHLQLPLAGIDLRKTPAGEYFCFEVNPMPAFSYYELHTGLPISREIARYLAITNPHLTDAS